MKPSDLLVREVENFRKEDEPAQVAVLRHKFFLK
jgi:hypothetical protein